MPVGHGSPCHGLVLAEPSVERRTEIGKRCGRAVRERSCRNRGIVGCVLLHIERVGRSIKMDAGYLEQPAISKLQIGGLVFVENEQLSLVYVRHHANGFKPVSDRLRYGIYRLVEEVLVAVFRINPKDVANFSTGKQSAAVRYAVQLLVEF